jgi:hypothetical protein
MPTHLYFGENEFFLSRTIKQLKTHTLDQQWANFNYTEYPPESKETIPQALSDIMTPPVGSGGRLVHLPNSTLLGICSKEIFFGNVNNLLESIGGPYAIIYYSSMVYLRFLSKEKHRILPLMQSIQRKP